MSKPCRIQLKRTRGWKMPPNTVKVDRTTKWGNPFKVGETYPIIEEGSDIIEDEARCSTPVEAVAMFRSWADSEHGYDREELEELTGKNLACWCKLGEPCHADVLLEIANATDKGGTE